VIFAVPLYDDNPAVRAPLATHLLIGLCIGAFLWELGQNQRLVDYSYGMIPAELFGFWQPPRLYRVLPPWATVFTSMFLHGGWLHLIGNMVFLWIFGSKTEGALGVGRYLLLYFGSGIAAALTQALAAPHSHLPMIGASGAIAGVLGGYLLVYPRANVHTFIWIIIFFRIINVPAWVLLGLWFAMQLLSGLSAATAGGVAVWAHVGGFLSGLLLLSLLRPPHVGLLHPRRTQVFAVRRPGYRGSVPPAGRAPSWRRGPWG
jgi:membrane associated rhomboid family serine protease